MAALILSVSLLTPALEVSAASTVNVSSETLYDIALAKVGIHVNNSLLSRLVNSHINALTGTAQSYWGFCKTEGLEKNAESWSAYVNSDSYATPIMQVVSWLQQTEFFLKWCWNNDETDFLGSDLVNAVLGKDTALAGESYKLDDELVESIHDDFQTFIDLEGLGYYYVPVYDYNKLDVADFADIDSFTNLKEFINNHDSNIPIAEKYQNYNKKGLIYIWSSNKDTMYVRPNIDYDKISFYSNDWSPSNLYYFCDQTYTWNLPCLDNTTMISYNTSFKNTFVDQLLLTGDVNGFSHLRFYGKEPGRQIIFNTLDDLKMYSVGQRPVYYTTNNFYDNSVDNSVEVTGDYLVNNGGALSYDTIYNQIQEGDVTTDNSINEIVNSNNQTIINNYYYTEDTGDSGSGDSGSGSFGDGIASFFEGLKSILDFLLGIIGDLATTLTSFLGSVYDLIKNIGGQFTGFSELLGELFVFIPQEIIDLLTAGIGVIIVVCIFKWLKG